eukprot:CAMPEP_0194348670 /NCGR_PEP_ID=MMETSP0171-20130528/106657_1 /TAXON_ID=218684 /ORGANISM="Corethron pennatum, Strain L29A3" /LENGTH=452 /DNA_ID=CAMNT_0039116031 /DNA_START=245 /DNA_END=1608 /DNA_ORIENTATION=-
MPPVASSTYLRATYLLLDPQDVRSGSMDGCDRRGWGQEVWDSNCTGGIREEGWGDAGKNSAGAVCIIHFNRSRRWIRFRHALPKAGPCIPPAPCVILSPRIPCTYDRRISVPILAAAFFFQTPHLQISHVGTPFPTLQHAPGRLPPPPRVPPIFSRILSAFDRIPRTELPPPSPHFNYYFDNMIVNDYYDSRSVDAINKPGDAEEFDPPFVRSALSFAYGHLLILSTLLPRVLPRLLVVGGTVVTYLYTVHLKPVLLLKNAVVASIVACCPLASASSFGDVTGGVIGLCGTLFLGTFGREVWMDVIDVDGDRKCGIRTVLASASSFGDVTGGVIGLCGTLFLGTFGREVWMDVIDVDGDRKCGIRTVPVAYGKRVGATLGGALLVLSGAIPMVSASMGGSRRRIVAAGLGMVAMMRTAAKAGGGGDDEAVLKAVEMSKGLPMALILTSYFLK